ncbi:precorrin-2 dehydrogenase/sirohydrochlorin ferrochelatase family protein [Tautonia plasticadhaerens]|uniref:precorrin-2 dehydrogenase n=1 Tax=Tautonia plasticadhaerens TaxID=2527974 RepID=A0A518H961_9BACT|nr:bifunctional precorrin-2 dehydrogenase/sirohydrochlorin ferrochelatase [Tautonia plasticadhaerens]QDV37371.1 Precorrin-2 dehydrogenase [Tautonia plasticadhaerens]
MTGYPIVLDLAGRRAVVVGLGTVGRRKAAGLVDAGAEVLGVDPVGPGPVPIPGIAVVAQPYRAEHLLGATLAFASAPPEVNRRVVADATRLGVLVNAASDPGSGDFTLPAVWRDGPILLAVSTSGAGPALAATLRDRASRAIGAEAGGLGALLTELRRTVRARVPVEQDRRRLLRDWSGPRWLDRWRLEGPEAVRAAMLAALEVAAESPGIDDPDPR